MTEGNAPDLRIVRGDPSAEELAALVAVLAVVSGSPAETISRPRSEWAAPYRVHRRPLAAGRGGWRASSLP